MAVEVENASTEVTERDLQAPIAELEDAAYQTLSNECGRRVFTVMQNLIGVRARNKPDQKLEGLEVQAILMGAMSGIGVIVSRMQLTTENPTPDAPPPEIALLNDLGNQFIHTIEQMRERDATAMMMSAGSGAEPQKAS